MTTAQRRTPVVVAVDGSERSTGAIRYGMQEARIRGTAARLVHVPGDTDREGRETVDRSLSTARAAEPGVEVGWLLGTGPRVNDLVTASARAGMLVLGRLALQGAGHQATGPTTAGVAAHAAVPVVVVPADWHDRGRGRVVVGVKSSAISGELLAHAFRTAAARGAALRVLHAVEPAGTVAEPATGDGDGRPETAVGDPVLEAMVRDWSAAYPDVVVTTSVMRAEPVRALTEAAAEADLLVVARHPLSLRHPVRLGPTPRTLLEVSDTPVEVFPLTGELTPPPLVLEQAGTIVKE
ncbi:universal stress protein [Myceligenerans indicum]|uniref:Universal stress protein n=1 Tax=Myceligenerans indicum TaxID=2593663 RepID=A0ABS1LFV7_9MICO|nr:universal stress protein [Myceligenerans indicum]MBL0885121.1 universal stress protein [Myceligenerans indicum]